MAERIPHLTGLLLDIPLPRQRLFGFLLDSAEGLATHSRAKDSDSLEIWPTEGQLGDLKSFLEAWDQFQSALDSAEEHTQESLRESGK